LIDLTEKFCQELATLVIIGARRLGSVREKKNYVTVSAISVFIYLLKQLFMVPGLVFYTPLP
jgi:hypothetical protein